MKLPIQVGTTSQSVYVFVQDSSSTTGAGLTGLAHDTAGLTAYYVRPRAAVTAIALATLASATAAWATGGFVEVDATNLPGVYRLDLPDAVLASGAESVVVMLKGAANMAPLALEILLTAYDPHDAAALGLSRLDAAVSSRSSHDAAAVATELGDGAAFTEAGGTGDHLTAVPDLAGVTTLLARLTAARAGYLDNLNVGGLVASQADVQAITRSARLTISTPSQMDVPDSGSQPYRIHIFTLNEQGLPEDMDSLPTATAVNGANVDRSSNLGTVTKVAATTGQYYVEYTVEHDAVHPEQITVFVTVVEDTNELTLPHSFHVVDVTAVGYTAADRARDDAAKAVLDAQQGDGAGLTDVPWNPAWDTEVQSECTDALNAYDGPTRAEATADKNELLAVLGSPAGASLAADIAAVLTTIAGKATPADVTAAVVAAWRTTTGTELSSPPAKDAPPGEQLQWLFQALRNGGVQTATERRTLTDAGATAGTQTVADDGTTLTLSKAV